MSGVVGGAAWAAARGSAAARKRAPLRSRVATPAGPEAPTGRMAGVRAARGARGRGGQEAGGTARWGVGGGGYEKARSRASRRLRAPTTAGRHRVLLPGGVPVLSADPDGAGAPWATSSRCRSALPRPMPRHGSRSPSGAGGAVLPLPSLRRSARAHSVEQLPHDAGAWGAAQGPRRLPCGGCAGSRFFHAGAPTWHPPLRSLRRPLRRSTLRSRKSLERSVLRFSRPRSGPVGAGLAPPPTGLRIAPAPPEAPRPPPAEPARHPPVRTSRTSPRCSAGSTGPREVMSGPAGPGATTSTMTG